jgi:hypothetical protein
MTPGSVQIKWKKVSERFELCYLKFPLLIKGFVQREDRGREYHLSSKKEKRQIFKCKAAVAVLYRRNFYAVLDPDPAC